MNRSMGTRRMVRAMLACGAMLTGQAAALADDAREAKREVAGLWNVDKLTSTAADNIARRYNLNDFQREQTHRMMSERVSGFLNDHEEIWPLVRDLYRYQIDGKMPDGETARQIGQSAIPLLEDIKEAILTANMEWREILSEEQQRLHDWDLNDLHRTFGKMEKNFSKMVQGEPVNPGVFPGPNKKPPQPNRPKKPKEEFKKPIKEPKTEREEAQEEWWGKYVERFIRDHELSEAQSVTCFSILSQLKARAADYRRSKQNEFDLAQTRLKEARKPGQPPQMREVWTQVNQKLNEPLIKLFQELKTRLAAVPSEAQRQKARANGHVYIYASEQAAKPASDKAAPGKPGAADGESKRETAPDSTDAKPPMPVDGKPATTIGTEKKD